MSDCVLQPELGRFEKIFEKIINITNRDAVSVFDDFLTYVIAAFNPEPMPNLRWVYKKEHNVLFYDLMREWIQVVHSQIAKRGWYDAFGDFFMACVGRNSRQYRGQFFTPQHICDLMAEITCCDSDKKEPPVVCGGFGPREIINDCACGSARLLLAAHIVNNKRGKAPCYYVAEDVDRMCCKMAAINMCCHGMFGEVVCHDTLTEPDKLNIGYIINEGLYPIPAVPTIRVVEDASKFVSINIWKAKILEKDEVRPEPVVTAKTTRQQKELSEQLTLSFFD